MSAEHQRVLKALIIIRDSLDPTSDLWADQEEAIELYKFYYRFELNNDLKEEKT